MMYMILVMPLQPRGPTVISIRGEEFNETLGKGVFHEPKGPDLH